jgi:predicted nucleic acid-binding protein
MRLSVASNLLVYAIDVGAGPKHSAAKDIMARAAAADCILTVQSLAEFFHATTRKGKLDAAKSASFVDRWRTVFPVHGADGDALTHAISGVRRHSLSFWDAMLWATVRRANCRLLLTEDLHDGQTIDGVTFVNPLAPKNTTLLEAALPRP